MQRQIRGRRPRQNARGGGGGSAQPRSLTATIQVDKVLRFKFTGALSNVQISDTDLLDLICVATTATAASQVASAIKVRRMEMWADPVAGGSLCSIEDNASTGPVGGPSRVKEDTTLGVSRPAHVIWRPAPGSTQSLWLQSELGNNWFQLISSGAGYLDVHVSWILQDGEAIVPVTAAVAGATAGRLYVRALDSNGAKSIVPVSYSTI